MNQILRCDWLPKQLRRRLITAQCLAFFILFYCIAIFFFFFFFVLVFIFVFCLLVCSILFLFCCLFCFAFLNLAVLFACCEVFRLYDMSVNLEFLFFYIFLTFLFLNKKHYCTILRIVKTPESQTCTSGLK